MEVAYSSSKLSRQPWSTGFPDWNSPKDTRHLGGAVTMNAGAYDGEGPSMVVIRTEYLVLMEAYAGSK